MPVLTEDEPRAAAPAARAHPDATAECDYGCSGGSIWTLRDEVICTGHALREVGEMLLDDEAAPIGDLVNARDICDAARADIERMIRARTLAAVSP